jgi:hypothetical protein
MAPSGNLELGVTINGKRAVAEAKVQGEAAGAAYQSGFNNAFDEGLSKIGSDVFADLRKRGAFEGDYVGDAFASKFRSRLTSAADDIANAFSFKGGLDDFAKDFDNVDEAAVHLRQSLTLLNDEGKIGESAFRRYGGSLNNWLGSARKTEVESDRVRAGMDDIGHALDREVVNFERVAAALDQPNKKGTQAGLAPPDARPHERQWRIQGLPQQPAEPLQQLRSGGCDHRPDPLEPPRARHPQLRSRGGHPGPG